MLVAPRLPVHSLRLHTTLQLHTLYHSTALTQGGYSGVQWPQYSGSVATLAALRASEPLVKGATQALLGGQARWQ